MRHGAITLFWRQALFDEAKRNLQALDYRIVEIACATCDQCAVDLGEGLNWSKQFGYGPWDGNLDAFNEGFDDAHYGLSHSLALCFRSFHHLVADGGQWAVGMLDVIEGQSRNQLLLGRRLLALVQTDDDRFFTRNLGGRAPTWNTAEWLNSARGR